MHPSLSVVFAGCDGDIAGPPVPEAHRALCAGPGVFQPGAEPPVFAAPGQAATGPRKPLGAGGHWDGHGQWLGHRDALLPPAWGFTRVVRWGGVASPCLWHGPAGSGVQRVAKEGDNQGFTHPALIAPWSCSVLQPG